MTEPAFARGTDKAPDAYRTISEVAGELGLPQHVLRFWESRFVQIRPLKRGGGRRYYRPDEISLLKGIQHLLYNEGYTIKGVQKVLKTQGLRVVQGLGAGRAMPETSRNDEDVADDNKDNIQPLTFADEIETEQDVEEQLAEAYDDPAPALQKLAELQDEQRNREPSLFDSPVVKTQPASQLLTAPQADTTNSEFVGRLKTIRAELQTARDALDSQGEAH